MLVSKRQSYIDTCRRVVDDHFKHCQMLVRYVRAKEGGKIPSSCTMEQKVAIRSFLNLTGGSVPPIPALRIINESLPIEHRFIMGTKEEKAVVANNYNIVRKNWASRKSPIIGVVVAIKTGHNNIKIGWSLCHENDKWNKYIGIQKAINFSDAHDSDDDRLIPQTLIRYVDEMTDRANRTYQKVKTCG